MFILTLFTLIDCTTVTSLRILRGQKSGILTLNISKWRKNLKTILNKKYFKLWLDDMQPHLFCYPVFKKRLLKSPSRKFFSRYFKNGTQYTNGCWTKCFSNNKNFLLTPWKSSPKLETEKAKKNFDNNFTVKYFVIRYGRYFVHHNIVYLYMTYWVN